MLCCLGIYGTAFVGPTTPSARVTPPTHGVVVGALPCKYRFIANVHIKKQKKNIYIYINKIERDSSSEIEPHLKVVGFRIGPSFQLSMGPGSVFHKSLNVDVILGGT